jgi:paraquat-inducible protein A
LGDTAAFVIVQDPKLIGYGILLLVGCHDCDAVIEEPNVPDGGAAICSRCGNTLFRRQRRTVEFTLALVSAAAILFVVANVYPFLSFEMQGQVTQTTLGSGTFSLWKQGQHAVALLVAVTTIVAPALQIGLLLFVLGPIHLQFSLPGAVTAFRWVEYSRPWSMMEVFLIGILVAVVKLSGMANIVPGLALGAFGLLIPVLAGASSFLDPEVVWREIGDLE